MENKIYVYEEFFDSLPKLMGYLYIEGIRGGEHHSFEFDAEWLKKSQLGFMIDPDLQYFPGRQYPSGKTTFGIFSDSCPDRWGRVLMDRRERLNADGENRKPRKLNDGDYLLGVYDETRMGAIRLKSSPDSPFLSDDAEMTVPPWTTIRRLEEASRNFENEETTLQAEWLNLLIKPGSSLGGARPKATVLDPDGNFWIAKFPSRKDDYNVGAWEKTAHDLANLCGLKSPETRLESFSKYGSTFLIKRFDRNAKRRLHYASAMAMLGKKDGDDDCGYLDIAKFLKNNASSPNEDLLELWKCIVFNMAITNSDDHLRNHGFLLTEKGWKLSPIFDINPVPYGDTLSLNVDEVSNEISVENAVSVANHFGLTREAALDTANEILTQIGNNWERLALSNGLRKSALEYMRPAFSLTAK